MSIEKKLCILRENFVSLEKACFFPQKSLYLRESFWGKDKNMEQWNVEAFRDRAKKFTEDARALSNDFQYAIGLRERQKEGEEMKKKICTVLAIIGGIIAFCGLAYGVYRLLAPDYLEDYEDYDDLEDEDYLEEE